MRAILQRVRCASVTVDGEAVGAIGPGLLVLLGVAAGDSPDEARRLASKTAELRIFTGGESRFDRSLIDTAGEALVVSQFTLLADIRKGRRPSFSDAAAPEKASRLVDAYAEALRAQGVAVAMGRFGAHMVVSLENDGPVTIVLDTADFDRPRSGKANP